MGGTGGGGRRPRRKGGANAGLERRKGGANAGLERRKGGANAGLEHVFDIMLSDAVEERRVALYARSERELERLRSHCSRRKLHIAVEFVEPGSPAARVAFEELLAALRSGDVNALAVTKLAGLARSLGELGALVRELEQRRIQLHAFEDEIDTSRGSGRDLFRLLDCVEGFERERQSQRTRVGLIAARRRGRRLGRPPVPIPISRAERMVADGIPVAEVARRLGVSRSSLRRALARHAS
jgi:DNA invertase Pin-like site-specific DNA recombinase